MKKIQAILLGCGMVGGGFIKETYRRGVEYVGVFDVADHLIGKDVGDVIQEPTMGVTIQHVSELESFIKTHQVDIAIDTATAPFERTEEEVKLLMANGINVLTSLADIYVMEKHFPELYKELDTIGKANNASFFASGIQDVFWTSLPIALTGCCLEMKEIRGTNVALIDYFGPGVADECYVGWDLDKFNQANESGELPINDFLIALYEIAKKLGLHPYHQKSMLKPLLAKKDMYCETIDRHVKAGQLIGNYVESTVKTEEGVDLCCEFVSKMSEEGDSDLNKWVITGVPNINVITERMQGEITTGSSMVNRLPDVINAAPGVIAASEMPAPFFKVRDLNEYVQ